MADTLDARGMAGLKLDLEIGEWLDAADEADLQVIVDDWSAAEAVAGLARTRGQEVAVERREDGAYTVAIGPQGRDSVGDTEEMLEPVKTSVSDPTRTVVFIGSDEMGHGEAELGRRLMLEFLRSVVVADPWPWRVVLVNRGVLLATAHAQAADLLTLMTDAGVEVLCCQASLVHHDLMDKVRAGRATTMPEIVESLDEAAKVIRV